MWFLDLLTPKRVRLEKELARLKREDTLLELEKKIKETKQNIDEKRTAAGLEKKYS